MTTSSQQCPKCGSGMVQGFVLDHTHGGITVSKWAAGAPVKSFWFGTRPAGEMVVPVGTFRCSSCGYLESYARHEFAAKHPS